MSAVIYGFLDVRAERLLDQERNSSAVPKLQQEFWRQEAGPDVEQEPGAPSASHRLPPEAEGPGVSAPSVFTLQPLILAELRVRRPPGPDLQDFPSWTGPGPLSSGGDWPILSGAVRGG